ncbi:MAG: shikimate dehydrogenase [Anaerolineae bacterium]
MTTSLELTAHVDGQTKLVGVFGWPVAHSLSPAMHNAAFHTLGLNWAYVPFAVSPEALPTAVAALRGLGICGVNATVPHKEALVGLMDDLTPEAAAIGAVNTILVHHNGLVGHNTDAAGFEATLKLAGYVIPGSLTLVLGAGGAARAVVYALLKRGARVVLLNRTLARAQELLKQIPGDAVAGELSLTELSTWAARSQLVVNTTTVGMWPHDDESPWPDSIPFPSSALLCDLVYNPRRTRLVNQALSAGARYVDGLWMLVYQGAESFHLWTGQPPDAEFMYRAADSQLGGQDAAISHCR